MQFLFKLYSTQQLNSNKQSSSIGDHPQEELAKLGYRSERKVKKIKNLAIEPIS